MAENLNQNGGALLTVHLHVPGRVEPETVTVEATVLVRELLVGFDGHQVWVEEAAVPLELEVSLAAAGIGHGTHLHRGPCHEVEVTVTADGREVAHRFPPSTRAATVTEWSAGQIGFGTPAHLELVDRRSGQVVAPGTPRPISLYRHRLGPSRDHRGQRQGCLRSDRDSRARGHRGLHLGPDSQEPCPADRPVRR